MASEWQTAFVVSHKMPRCALLTAIKNYNKSLEELQDFFFKTETKNKCSRPRPRLSFLSSRHLETKTLVSKTTSLVYMLVPMWTRTRSEYLLRVLATNIRCEYSRQC